jgi:hypothetical protein
MALVALRTRPITRALARRWINRVHRHLRAPVGDVIRVALETEHCEIVGVGMAGRPTARRLDDGRTIEITRIAVLEGYPNACSMLYGALRRASLSLGWRRLVTYTLPEEGGASLRASGWRLDGLTNGGEWDRPSRSRGAAARADVKSRWVYPP